MIEGSFLSTYDLERVGRHTRVAGVRVVVTAAAWMLSRCHSAILTNQWKRVKTDGRAHGVLAHTTDDSHRWAHVCEDSYITSRDSGKYDVATACNFVLQSVGV